MKQEKVLLQITSVIDLEKEQDFRDYIVARVHTSHISNYTDLKAAKFKRGSYVKINNLNGNSIVRLVRGESSKDVTSKTIRLDYDSRLQLGIAEKQGNTFNCNLSLSPASYYDISKLFWLFPDQCLRASFRIAISSLLITLISLLH